uniref:RNA-dependent RNA polymerase n=1 Tax=Rice drawf polerovirus TaxID=3229777 RepID=A0AAU8EJF3_9VIRU
MEFRSYAIFLLAAFTLLPFSSQGRPEALGGADFFFDVGKPLIFLDGGWQQATLPAWSSISDPPSCTCAKCPELTESSYSELSQALFQKVSAQTHELFSEARGTSARAWNLICENLKTTFHLVLGTFLWLTAYSWAYILLAVLSTIWTLLAQHYVPVAFLVSLGIITVLICRAFKWIFGTGPTSLFIASLKYIFKTLTFRKYFDEKAIEGYKAYSIPQKPPKHSVVQIRRSDRSHIGYAVSVSLYNGKSALVTANHNMEEGCEFHSFRTGRAIKAADFRLLFLSKELDVILMEGPPNYESVLGCGSVHFTTSDILAKCPAALYAFEDGEWLHKSASVVGHHDHFATVLSQTQKGHSGGGYFHGKTLVGLHKGHPGAEYNYNLMITIPPIPGLTSPLYSVESDPPQGRVFSEGEVDKIEQIAEETAERLEKEAQRILEYKPVSGRLWADYEDELGNRDGGRVRLNNRKRPTRRHPFRAHCPRGRCSFGSALSTSSYCTIPGHSCGFWPTGHNESSDPAIGERGGHLTSGEICDRSNRTERPQEAPSAVSRETGLWQQAEDWKQYFASLYTWKEEQQPETIPGFKTVGKLKSPQYFPRAKSSSEWGKRVCAEHPELATKTAGFGWPQVGANAELRSLRLQAARWLERSKSAKRPSDAARQSVINRTVEAYSNCKTNMPRCTQAALSWKSFLEDFNEAIHSLQLDAGVGVPMIAAGWPTHRGWVEDPERRGVLARLTYDRLLKMSQASAAGTPTELVKEGLCDPIRLFVKQEPHKQSKLDEGRYRLIMSISLVDQLVARVLFQAQNKSEIALWRAIPSRPGFGLSTEDQVHDFMEVLASTVGCSAEEVCSQWRSLLVPTDCSGFDWSVSDWMLEDDMAVRNALTINCNELTKHMRAVWLHCLSNSVMCLSDGTMLSQEYPGVQKSGSYNTSSTNSRIRVMAAYHCGASWAMAMGDDALEAPDTDLSKYKDLGFKVEVSGELEFCSHIFKAPDLAIPVNANKMLYRLIHGYNPECGNHEVLNNYLNAAVSVLHELRHDKELVAKLFEWLISDVTTKQI